MSRQKDFSDMRRHRRAKIVATVGPASASPEMLKAGEKYRLADTPPPSHELLARTRAAFSNQGLIVT
ncbi:hypothetical protein FNL55_19845 [Tardiphaga sp. vice352]|uniref:hypothetical protein n=1 Tax=unclassified Tardiphaga TaxID=2631404 RepID=UPI001163A214|nr:MULTISPECIES: hypothetical protein [unclassified Tardiphaga]MBC7585012.1 hypothetical protein [Tardiphaga sp.]QDM18009.1 hypothetical protein FNL53_20175 [Tardiphaga sp. vice278]QDM23048.1 hypothetical protein FIU28_19225 [Tardiphaga sp. vice154]QDM28214.1 hypothetical protein FNL56_20345 [Tardiphaga sp. vice304]QDM33357.1 hypothetical protein FNL55_19845 [Tardiphaga sp. vice352]